MRNRILAIVLALGMITVLFAAVPTKAAESYTGTVITTDNTGTAKVDFLQGEPVYIKANVLVFGAPVDTQIRVSLERTDGGTYDSFTDFTDTPVTGWYNSTAPGGQTLYTGSGFSGDVQSYYVILTLWPSGNELARTEIVVRHTGLTLSPASPYWPGENVDIRLVIAQVYTADVFYVQVTNQTEVGGIGNVTYQNYTDQSAANGYWSNSFQVGNAWPDGNYYVSVRAKLTHSLWYIQAFSVHSFDLNVLMQRTAYLPGETAKITYFVLDRATLAPMTSGLAITYNVSYFNKTLNLTWMTGSLDPNQNIWNLQLPRNGTGASTDIGLFSNVDVEINATQTSGDRKDTFQTTLAIGMIDGSVSLNSDTFNPGDTVVVTVTTTVYNQPLDNASVSVTVLSNGTTPVPAYAPTTGLVTDANGQATYFFKLASTAQMGNWNYIVKANITKVGYTAVRENQFQVSSTSDLLVAFDRDYYYGGQEAVISFAAILNGQTVPTGEISYTVMLASQLIANATTTDTTASVSIPQDKFGALQVDAKTLINGVVRSDSATVQVVFALLGLTPKSDSYRPGETITFQWSILTGLTEANLAYEIVDSNNLRVANGTLTFAKTGSFEYRVPEASPLLPDSYDATMWMTTPTGGFASDTATVDIVSGTGMELTISIGKSPYTSGEFRPGGKVTVHYDLASFLTEPRSSLRLHVLVSYDPMAFDVIVSSSSGKFTYTIPDDAPMAEHTVTVWAYDAVTDDFLSADQSAFQVNNQVSGWDRSVGGVSVIDLILLVLVIVVIIMLIVVPMMKDRMARPKPPESKPMVMAEEPGKTPPPPPSP